MTHSWSRRAEFYHAFLSDACPQIRVLGIRAVYRIPLELRGLIALLRKEPDRTVQIELLEKLTEAQELEFNLPQNIVEVALPFTDVEQTEYSARRLLEAVTYNAATPAGIYSSEPEQHREWLARSRRLWEQWWKENKDKSRVEWFRLGLQREIESLQAKPAGNDPTWRLQNRLTSLRTYGLDTPSAEKISQWKIWWADHKGQNDVTVLSVLLKEANWDSEKKQIIYVIGSLEDPRFLSILKPEFIRVLEIRDRPRPAVADYAYGDAITSMYAIIHAVWRITKVKSGSLSSGEDVEKSIQSCRELFQ